MMHVLLIAQMAATAATAPAQRQLIIAADISPSQPVEVVREHAALASALAGRLAYGDRLVVIPVREKGVTAARAGRTVTAPDLKDGKKVLASDKRRLTAFHSTAVRMTREVIDPEKSKALSNTDLFATLQFASEYAKDRGSRKPILVILSDMLQTVGVNFEKGAPPGSAWIAQQKNAGLIPDLSGACVIVIGADATTPHGLKVKAFWEGYLRAANARVQQYRLVATDAGELGCGL